MNLSDAINRQNIAGRLFSELVCAVTSANCNRQGITLGSLNKISGLLNIGKQLFSGHCAISAVSIFLVALHSF